MGELRAIIFKFLRNAAIVIAGLLVLLLLTYGSLALWWRSGRVVISRDVVGEIMARNIEESGPVPAWPDVVRAFEPIDFTNRPIGIIHPNNKKWDHWMTVAESNAADIAAVRAVLSEVGRNKRIGIFASTVRQTPDGWIYDSPDSNVGQKQIRNSYDLLVPIADTSSDRRLIIQFLELDTWRAVRDGDSETATANLVAAFHFCEQTRETTFVISDLMGNGAYSQVYFTVAKITEEYPDLFSTDQLLRLRDASLVFMNGNIRPALTDEYSFCEDIEQRIFTDDGAGGGHPVIYFPDYGFGEELPLDGRQWSWIGPLWLPIAPTREQYGVMTQRTYDALLADFHNPIRARHHSALDELADELDSTWLNRQRWTLQSVSTTSMSWFASSYTSLRFRQLGAHASLAAMVYRSEHGHWPASLNDLVPAYLDEVPADPYGGADLRYRIDDARGIPVLYSIGANGVDDGGSLKSSEDTWFDPEIALDLIIWPLPTPVDDTEFITSDNDEDPDD